MTGQPSCRPYFRRTTAGLDVPARASTFKPAVVARRFQN